MTAVGRIRLTRRYLSGSWTGFPADDVVGIDGYLTRAAQRMATLAGVRQSFAKAEQLLTELCGWDVDDETIRQATHQAAKSANAARPERDDAARFAAASGHVEGYIDAGKVNTTEGWRDVKMAVFARRTPGAPATPEEWTERDLPAVDVRTVIAAIEEAEQFGTRVRTEADRLGVTTAADVTMLGDGAEWIWNLSDAVVPQADEVLDIYHAIEHLADAAKALWGEGTLAMQQHLDASRHELLSQGKAGLEQWIANAFAQVPAGVSTEPLLKLAGYFAKHPTRLDYADRLAAGRTIGSGLVEGSVKQLVNLRLKRTGARWRADKVGPLVELLALADTPDWPAFWMSA